MLTEWNLTNPSRFMPATSNNLERTTHRRRIYQCVLRESEFDSSAKCLLASLSRAAQESETQRHKILYGERRLRLRRDLRTFEIQFLDLFRVGKRRLLVDLFKLASGDLMATLRRPVEIPCEHCQFSERLAHPCPSPLFCLLPDGKRSCRESSSGQQTL